jgi:hypothetical protein
MHVLAYKYIGLVSSRLVGLPGTRQVASDDFVNTAIRVKGHLANQPAEKME